MTGPFDAPCGCRTVPGFPVRRCSYHEGYEDGYEAGQEAREEPAPPVPTTGGGDPC